MDWERGRPVLVDLRGNDFCEGEEVGFNSLSEFGGGG